MIRRASWRRAVLEEAPLKRAWSPRIRLWVKLALFAVAGVSVTHAIHLALASRVASRAIASEQTEHGRELARMIVQQATDAVLVDDSVMLQEIVDNAVASNRVAYCFIEREGTVLSSSFHGGTPPGLLSVRPQGGEVAQPILIESGAASYLDISEPILGGLGGWVRLGLGTELLRSTQEELGTLLGWVAAVVVLVGIGAAFVVGRRIAKPLSDLVVAADSFDPVVGGHVVVERGSDEIADLVDRFNQMTARLQGAHEERQRLLQKNVASERLVALGQLVGGVAHEVNNPLAGLKNCLSWLRKNDLSETRRQEYLELMGEALGRIQEVVGRLLDFGRPRAMTLREERLNELAQEGAKLVRPVLKERGIEWREDPMEVVEGLKVLADRHQVAQALLNLLLNAAYVTPTGGEIRLRLRSRPSMAGIAVEDDGPGIPEAIRKRVLDPYFTTKPEGQGTGLGLSVTQSIVDAHGGELTFEFPERGTVVTIWLRNSFSAQEETVVLLPRSDY